jgi:hypothetical protein
VFQEKILYTGRMILYMRRERLSCVPGKILYAGDDPVCAKKG